MRSEYSTLESLDEYNFQYYIDYYANESRNCEGNGCNEEGICRCSKIEDVTIQRVNVSAISSVFCKLSEDLFTKYCIDRAVFHSELNKPESWNVSTCGGYYGEEVENIKLEHSKKIKLFKLLSSILEATSNRDKLFIVLENEYGYILPELKNFDEYVIKMVPFSLIKIGNKHHYKKVDKDIVNQYTEYDLPIGVALSEDGQKYRLIDGYHRYKAKENKRVINIVTNYIEK